MISIVNTSLVVNYCFRIMMACYHHWIVIRNPQPTQELEMMNTDELMILCHKKGLPIDPRRLVAPMEVFGTHLEFFQFNTCETHMDNQDL